MFHVRYQIKEEEITPYLKKIFKKYSEFKNKFTYNFGSLLRFKICGRERFRNGYKIMKFFSKKILRKFDMFYY